MKRKDLPVVQFHNGQAQTTGGLKGLVFSLSFLCLIAILSHTDHAGTFPAHTGYFGVDNAHGWEGTV